MSNEDELLVQTQDPLGNTTSYAYDIFGNTLKEEVFAPEGTLFKTTSAAYNAFCKLSETDACGITTFYTYDAAGQLLETRKENSVTTYTYDALSRLATEQIDDCLTTTKYDFLDRVAKKTTNNRSETFAYDAAGNQIEKQTPMGTWTTEYDLQNKPIRKLDPLGNETTFSSTYTDHKILSITDPHQTTRTTHYDFRNLPTILETSDGSGNLIEKQQFTYDLNGNKIKETHFLFDGTQVCYQWEYDKCNRVTRLIENPSKVTSYFYDASGRLIAMQKPDQTKLHRSYDPLGRLQTFSSNDFYYIYSYDAEDRLLSIQDSAATTNHTYDALGNLTQETLANGLNLKSAFDTCSRRTHLLLPNQQTIQWTYQGSDLTQTHYNGYTTTITARDPHGKPTQITTPVGTLSQTFDAFSRPKTAFSPYYSHNLSYDALGNLKIYTYSLNDETATEAYSYDALKHLSQDPFHTYKSDSLHNRRAKDTSIYQVNDLCQISDYLYDLNGNLLADDTNQYTYDSQDRLISVQTPSETITYTYDPFHRRLSKHTSQETTLYLWDGKNEIGSLTEDHTFKDLRILSEGFGAEIASAALYVLNKQTYVPIHDHRGSLLTLIDTKTQIPAATYTYTPFGEKLSSSSLSPWQYMSKRFDPETAHLYFGRRYYNPSLGRWITPDPQGFQDGPNLYAYLYNNPLTGFDLYGLSFTDFLKGFGPATLDLAFPSITTYYNLPQGTSNWTYAAVGAWVIADVALAALPAAKLTSMSARAASRSTTLLTKQVSKAVTRRSLARTAGKVEGVAFGKIASRRHALGSTGKTTRFISKATIRDKYTKKSIVGTVDLQPTLNRIKAGKSFPHRNDGTVFRNSDKLLPLTKKGYYREFVHPTPGIKGPGPQRVITGKFGEFYYTPDHYDSFILLNR